MDKYQKVLEFILITVAFSSSGGGIVCLPMRTSECPLIDMPMLSQRAKPEDAPNSSGSLFSGQGPHLLPIAAVSVVRMTFR